MPLDLLPHHRALVEGSGISAEVAQARGYRSLTVRAGLERLGFAPSQRLVPTLLIPIHDVNGQLTTYQHRPDTPRVVAGKPLKYETARGSRMVLDVPPGARPWLAIPERPLFVTEGARRRTVQSPEVSAAWPSSASLAGAVPTSTEGRWRWPTGKRWR